MSDVRLPRGLRIVAHRVHGAWCWSSSTCRWLLRAAQLLQLQRLVRAGRRESFTLRVVATSPRTTRAPATRCGPACKVAPLRDRDRAGARHARGDGAAAHPLLRPPRRLVADHPADRPAGHRHRHRAAERRSGRSSASSSACSRSSSRTRRSASSRSSTTCRPGSSGSAATSSRRRWTSAPGRSRRSGWSRCRCCARPCSPVRCWRSGCPSTRSWSPRSPRAARTRRCRSGSSTTCSGPTRRRSSTSSRPR